MTTEFSMSQTDTKPDNNRNTQKDKETTGSLGGTATSTPAPGESKSVDPELKS
jgi:hypothetical protein